MSYVDRGVISDILYAQETLIVDFGNNKSINFTFKESETLQLVYAISVHKSQGFEFPAVVTPLTRRWF